MLFDSDDMNYSFFNMMGLNNNSMNSSKLVSSKEGLLKGNMFKDEYVPYKNLSFIKINPKNDRESKLFTVMEYSFAINDLNLYLDVNPDDTEMLQKLEEYIKKEKDAKEEYIASYGPLDICETDGNKFKWVDSPWSWENDRGEKYV